MHNRPETVSECAPGVIRILAHNPSPMTYWGTNSYLIGSGPRRMLIDPGPDLPDHRDAILSALPTGAEISHILVSHAHVDHSAGTGALARETGAVVLAFGTADAGRSPHMQLLHAEGATGGGEGVDHEFQPDRCLNDGATVRLDDTAVTALHTPGHMGNHLCFQWSDLIFCGDLIMGWSSSLISPPDGDAAAFRDSCAKLLDRRATRLLPGHGAPIDTPRVRIEELLAHRALREDHILQALHDGPLHLPELTRRVYSALPDSHLPAAARNTLAHLIDLHQKHQVHAAPSLNENASFSIL